MTESDANNIPPPSDDRRTFFKKVLAVAIGTIIVLSPSPAGLTVPLDPLRRKTNKAEFLPVTNLDALPDDDLPHAFQVIADRRDAWNLYPAQRIGAVYLRRNKDKVTALNVVCPHLG